MEDRYNIIDATSTQTLWICKVCVGVSKLLNFNQRITMAKSTKIASRRAFVKAAAVGGVAVAGLISGCGKKTVKQSEVIKGKSKKQEILYRSDTKAWKAYFAVAK